MEALIVDVETKSNIRTLKADDIYNAIDAHSEPFRRVGRANSDHLMADRFKFQRVNEITGTFVLVVVVVLIAAVVWTGRSQRWFRSNVTLRIILPEDGAAGIRQGSEVYFLGTLVGSVHDVLVDTTGGMEARTTIRHDFFRFVRAEAK